MPKKKMAVVTGAFGGIGSAIARTFIEVGWDIIGIDTVSGIPSDKNWYHICADLAIEAQVQSVFEEIGSFSSGIDALINNAAIQVCKSIHQTTVDDWDMVMNSNVRSTFLCCKHGYSLLKRNLGSIVNISSVHALATSRDISVYAASKGAILSLTRAMAIEFAVDNIRVNAVLPGATDTQMLRVGLWREGSQGSSEHELLSNLSHKHVLKRIGQPGEIAKAVYFLADNKQSSFVTGQALVCDGGALSRLSTE